MRVGRTRKRLEKIGKTELFRIGKFKFEAWMLIAILFIGFVFRVPIQHSIFGSGYEGPQQEFVAVRFDHQAARSQGRTVYLDGTYDHNDKLRYASKWDWGNPSNVHLDPDEQKAGVPDLYFTESGFGQVDTDLQDSGRIIDQVEYTIRRNGKDWRVKTYLYWFKSYVTLQSIGDENYLNPAFDEVDWKVKCDVYVKIGINRWSVQEYNNELWAGILKVEVREAHADEDSASISNFSPNTRSILALQGDIGGGDLGQYNFDDFSSGWQNPDKLPDRGYYKLSLDFKVGKTVTNKLKHPWAKLTVVSHVLVTHRWILTDENLGQDIDPVVNQDKNIWDTLFGVLDELIKGVDIFENLAKLLLFAIIGLGVILVMLIIIPNIFRRR